MASRAPLALLVGLTLAACGGGDDPAPKPKPAPKPVVKKAESAEAKLIRAWADELRNGHVAKATALFSLPTIVSNSGPAVKLKTRVEVRFFNLSLPCGAKLRRTIKGRHYTIATFELTDRVGSHCDGTGNLAATAFAFRKGKISEWRRVTVPPEPPTV